MNTMSRSRISLFLLCALMGGSAVGREEKAHPATAPDGTRIEQLTGAKGALDPAEPVFKVAVPRTDLQVTVDGIKLVPAMGLTSWAAFSKAGAATQVMGDMVLLEDQVGPAMDAALAGGLEVTALHNHFLWETPRVMFMHIAGHGDEEKLATAVGSVFASLKAPGTPGRAPGAAIDPAMSSLDPGPIEAALGVKGTQAGGVHKWVIGDATHLAGHAVGNAMGVNTWAAFAGSNERAAVDGDFVMREEHLQAVLGALRKAGIQVVAIHQHMVGESPRMMFLHYWGVGRAADLARGLKSALEARKS